MNSTTTKKNKKGQVVKLQMEGENQEEVIVSSAAETEEEVIESTSVAETKEEVNESTSVLEAETQMNAEVQEEVVQYSTYVGSLWNQYEQILDQARKFHDRSEEAYLKTVKDVIKFNKQYRKSIADFYTGARRTNREIVKGVSSNIAKNNVLNQETDNFTKKAEEVSERLEQLAATPIKLTVDLIERLEDKVEETNETIVHYSREGRKGLQKVTNEYVKLAKHNNNMVVNLLENSAKVVVNSNR